MQGVVLYSSTYIFLKKEKRFYLFSERGERKEKKGEKHQLVASQTPPARDWPATQACALTGNRTSDPLVCRLALKPLSHTSQGIFCNLCFKRFYLFIFTERGREGEKHQCARDTSTGCLSHTPNWVPGPKPRHMP